MSLVCTSQDNQLWSKACLYHALHPVPRDLSMSTKAGVGERSPSICSKQGMRLDHAFSGLKAEQEDLNATGYDLIIPLLFHKW